MLVAFGAALVSPTVAGYLSRVVDRDDQGRALGGLQSVGSMGRIIGPPAAGFLNEMGGAGMAFLGSATMALVAAASASRARRLLK
jgi:MFS family permease